jgi:nicotinate-nucleotide pyrophosphorylase (carboxylating)
VNAMPKGIISEAVGAALHEDIGHGDITAALLPASLDGHASLLGRERAVVCGQAWAQEVFDQLDSQVTLDWQCQDGDVLESNQVWCQLHGPARSLVTGERVAMNFLQTLSATATQTHQYVQAVAGTKAVILDTRKTLPGWRLAQKYAVRCGGGSNHRIGLDDAYLIKENHIEAMGGLKAVVRAAQATHRNCLLEVEVEDLTQLEQALACGVPRVLLDNFSLAQMNQAVTLNDGQAELEVSGNVTLANIAEIAATGIDFISVGALTKHIQAIDLSMRMAPFV